MAENTTISWCDATFNPWEGCTKVSDGCKNCYAEARAARFDLKVWGPTADRRRTSVQNWKKPVKWNREAAGLSERPRVFCASLADVFEGPETCQNEGAYTVIQQARRDLWNLICATPNLDWLLLTKRPENILRFTPGIWETTEFPRNIWVGTTVENQKAADERIPHLLKIPAVVRFLSCEPMVGPVTLWRYDDDEGAMRGPGIILSGGMTASTPDSPPEGYDDSQPGIDWVICGGESGHHARPMNPNWARSLREQCQLAGVPFHFKQWGEFLPSDQPDFRERLQNSKHSRIEMASVTLSGEPDPSEQKGIHYAKIGKHDTGRMLDGREWNEFPQSEVPA